jgi:hypothetical protein
MRCGRHSARTEGDQGKARVDLCSCCLVVHAFPVVDDGMAAIPGWNVYSMLALRRLRFIWAAGGVR